MARVVVPGLQDAPGALIGLLVTCAAGKLLDRARHLEWAFLPDVPFLWS